MSSYWWPLGRAAPPPPAAGPAASTTSTATARGASTGGTAAGSKTTTSSTTAELRHLAQTAFHASLDSLLVEATKHRSLVVLRDAVQDTRQRRYDPASLFDTLCIACSLLAERSGTSSARSFSNASSAAQAAAEGAIEGARKVLRSSSSGGGGVGGSSHGSGQHTAAGGGDGAKPGSSMTSLPSTATLIPSMTGGAGSAGAPATSHGLHYRHHGTARNLLLQSIGDVGKLIALGLLPVTLPVGQRVADLIREIAFVPSAAAAHTPSPSNTQRATSAAAAADSSFTHAATAAATPPPPPPPRENDLASASDGVHGGGRAARSSSPSLSGPVQLVNDDPVLVRLLQLTASAASACTLGSPALPELYGVLILFYSGVAPQSMLEATCEATLTHHIHTVLSALRDNNSTIGDAGDDASSHTNNNTATTTASVNAPFAAQLQGIAFMKDICRLMIGARTRWLHLSAQRGSGGGERTGSSERGTEAAAALVVGSSRHALGARKATNSASSSMAAVTASVVAADAERQQQQQQQKRPSQTTSLTSTPMITSLAVANREASVASFGSPMLGSTGGDASMESSPPHAMTGPSSSMECVPERLRAFLMRAVTLFFKEQTKSALSFSASPSPAPAGAAADAQAALNASPLFVQCLNDCLFSVALWGMYEMDVTVPMQPPPSLFVEVMQQQYTASHSAFVCSLDLFTCTQQLALVTMSTHLPLMSNAAQILMEAHERLLQRLYRKQKMRGTTRSPVQEGGGGGGSAGAGAVADAYAERLSQAAIAVLTLWRKTLTSTTLLWELQQLRAARSGGGPATSSAAAGVSTTSTSAFHVGGGHDEDHGDGLRSVHVAQDGGGVGAVSTSFFHSDGSGSFSGDDDDVDTHEYDSEGIHRTAERQRQPLPAHRGQTLRLAVEGNDDDDDVLSSDNDAEQQHRRSGTSSHSVSGNTIDSAVNAADPTISSSRVAGVRTRPQPLTLARPQPLAIHRRSYDDPASAHDLSLGDGSGAYVDGYDDDNKYERLHQPLNVGGGGGLQEVGSPRLEMPPLARLVVSVVTLVMAYMQTPPRAPLFRRPAAASQPTKHTRSDADRRERGGEEKGKLAVVEEAGPLSATPPHDLHDVPVEATGAAPSSPRRRKSRHAPVLPFCLGATPQTVYQCLTESINFITVFGQYFCQLVEKHRACKEGNDADSTRDAAFVMRRSAACFADLHPYLIRCGGLCLRYLRYEEDVLPVVLKGISYWVQACCAMELAEKRDAYLSLLLGALRIPDPVVGHLIALAPPTSLMAGTASAAAGTAKTAMAALEGLILLHDHYAAQEPIVPGSVAAAAFSGENVGDFRDASPHGHGGSGSGTSASISHSAAANMASWGVGWLRRRGRAATSSSHRTVSPAHSSPHGGPQLLATGEKHRGEAADARATTPSPAGSALTPAQQQQQPVLLTSRGWRSPAVQHVVVLAVCRLQHKIMIMKTLHVLANALGSELDGGWALLARGMALSEPLLHMLKRLLTWIEETSVEQEQQEQVLSDALHLRDALRSLCVNNTCRLPYAQLNVFFSGLVNGTASLSPYAAEVKKTAGVVMSGHSWSAAFEDEDAAAAARDEASLYGTDIYDFSTPASPYTTAYAGLPRHDPQGCADQWVLTSECLCLSMLAVLPFTEQRSGAELATAGGGEGGASPPIPQQRQRTGALMRALRLWQLETDICRFVMDPRRVAHWATTFLISAAAHKRILLSSTAEARHALHDVPSSQLLSASLRGELPRPTSAETLTDAPKQTTPAAAATSYKDKKPSASPIAPVALSEDDARMMEATLAAVVSHVALVAAHVCRSASRRRSSSAAGVSAAPRDSALSGAGRFPRSSTNNNNNLGSGGMNNPSQPVTGAAAEVSYQAVQSAALLLTAGPFAGAPLVQIANALFTAPAMAASPAAANAHNTNQNKGKDVSNSDPSLLPFVQADAALSTASLLYGLQRAVQTSSALSRYASHDREEGVFCRQPGASVGVRGAGGGGAGAVLDPLEQLLASPFVLLDDVYEQWSQPQRSAAETGEEARAEASSSHDISTESNAAAAAATTQEEEEEKKAAPPQPSPHHDASDVEQERKNFPALLASLQSSVVPEAAAAAAAAVAKAVPQLLRSAATTVLMDVVKVVQAYGEDIDGAAWEPILALLQRTATLTAAATNATGSENARGAAEAKTAKSDAAAGTNNSNNNSNSGGGGSAQTVESLNTAFRALESIQHNHIPRLKVEGLHRLIVCVGAFTVHRVDGGVPGERKLHINLSAVQLLWSTADYLAAFGGGAAAEALSTSDTSAQALASRSSDNDNGRPSVSAVDGGVRQGAGMTNYVSDGASPGWQATAAPLTAAQQQERLWCSLLWQLRSGCLDDRQEIRQSAMQTFFALVQTYGYRFSGSCWRCVLHGVLTPLIEVVAAATALCATPPPPVPQTDHEHVSPQQQQGTGSDAQAVDVADASITADPAPAAAAVSATLSDPAVQRLLSEFMAQPPQLEEARVTLYDAASRLFVTHYANMQAALQPPMRSPSAGFPAAAATTAATSTFYDAGAGLQRPASPAGRSPPFRSSPPFRHGGAEEPTAVLEALLRLCGDVCVVVKGTSGEQSAVAAVHAVHGLLVETPGNGLHPQGVHLAWRAMERLLFRGDAPGNDRGGASANASAAGPAGLPYAHTEAKQCTLAVVAAIVAAVCDSFRLQRMVAAAATAAANNTMPLGGGGGGGSATASMSASATSIGYGGSSTAAAASAPHDGAQGPVSNDLATSGSGSNFSAGGGGFSSYFAGWGSKAAKPVVVGSGRGLLTSPEAQRGSPAQYFTRLLFVLQAVTQCNAVVNSYYFPSKPQSTLLEGVTAVWPTLTSREARMLWGEVLLPAFPSAEEMQRFVLQDMHITATEKPAEATPAVPTLVSLKSVLPPGSHPSYLSAVMDTMRSLLLLHMGIESGAAAAAASSGSPESATQGPPASSEEDRTRLLFMAPSTVQVTGALLLLHLASPAVLAGPPRVPGAPFTVPALFLQECADLLQFTLWGPVLSRAPTAATPDAEEKAGLGGPAEVVETRQSSMMSAMDGSLPAAAAAARCRREGVATLCRVVERFLTSTSTVVRCVDALSRPSNVSSFAAPPTQSPVSSSPLPPTSSAAAAVSATTITTTTVPQYVTVALQALDRLVDTLGEVVHLVMEQYDDVSTATEAINALSLASTAEGMALARVAKRSLALLQRWADAVGAAAGPVQRGGTSAASPLSSSTTRGSAAEAASGQASRSQLQHVVRASMETRNKAILRQYIDNPDDASAAALLVDTLRDLLRVAQNDLRHDESNHGTPGAGATAAAANSSTSGGGGGRTSLEQWDALMPELLQLVACSSSEQTRSASAVAREREVRETLSATLLVLHAREQQLRWRHQQQPDSFSASAQSGGRAAAASQRRNVSAAEIEEAMSII